MAKFNPAYIRWDDEQLKAAGIHKGKLKKLARMLGECSEIMREMDLHVYGQSGTGHLIHKSRPTHTGSGLRMEADIESPVATVGIGYDGGDW